MEEKVFHSVEELKAYLKTVPPGIFVKIRVEVEGDGKKKDSDKTE